MGFIFFLLSLTIAGFLQGQNWLNGVPEVIVLPQLLLWNIMRAVAGGLIYVAGWLQLVNVMLTVFVDTRAREARIMAKDAGTASPRRRAPPWARRPDEGVTDDGRQGRRKFLPSYYAAPRKWGPHPRKHMLMTPWLVFFGGIFAFAVPTLMGAFWQQMFFSPPISNDFAPLTAAACPRQSALSTGTSCYVCHSGYVRPQDVREGLYFTYPRVSQPGDFVDQRQQPQHVRHGAQRARSRRRRRAGIRPTGSSPTSTTRATWTRCPSCRASAS